MTSCGWAAMAMRRSAWGGGGPRRLPDLEEDFSNIWVKTAAILKFGADYFKALRAS